MSVAKTFVAFSLLLLALFLIQWWLLFYQLTGLPEYIPDTPIKISGLALAITILPILYFFLKAVVSKKPEAGVLQLTGWGVLLIVVTETAFQIIRQAVANSSMGQKISESIRAVGIAGFIIVFISFMMAFKLKHKNSVWNTVILVLFFVIVYLLKTYTGILK